MKKNHTNDFLADMDHVIDMTAEEMIDAKEAAVDTAAVEAVLVDATIALVSNFALSLYGIIYTEMVLFNNILV